MEQGVGESVGRMTEHSDLEQLLVEYFARATPLFRNATEVAKNALTIGASPDEAAALLGEAVTRECELLNQLEGRILSAVRNSPAFEAVRHGERCDVCGNSACECLPSEKDLAHGTATEPCADCVKETLRYQDGCNYFCEKHEPAVPTVTLEDAWQIFDQEFTKLYKAHSGEQVAADVLLRLSDRVRERFLESTGLSERCSG